MNNYIEAWTANNAERANSMYVQIQKVNLLKRIDGRVLQIAIPHNFYTSFWSNGIITNTDCAFITLSRRFYSFSGDVYSRVDVFEK